MASLATDREGHGDGPGVASMATDIEEYGGGQLCQVILIGATDREGHMVAFFGQPVQGQGGTWWWPGGATLVSPNR